LETFSFLPLSGEKIFSVTHRPESRRGGGGVLMLHPFAEEKLWVGRASTRLARALCDAGLPVLRFDHRGHGDSDRAHHEMTLASMVEDIAVAAESFRETEGIEELHLFGFRLGGTLALRQAAELGASSVGVVNPVAAGGDYLMKALRSNLTTQMGIYGEVRQDREALLARMRETGLLNLDGYHLNTELFDDLSAIDLTADPAAIFPGPSLILSLLRREGANADAESRKLFAALPGQEASRLDTLTSPPIWGEQKTFAVGDDALFAPFLDWFGGQWRGEASS
jgi:pimeloyl-ACP methyl ester carboxylesterase